MFNTKLKIVSIFLLLSISFVFSHSELGQCETKENGSIQHDYCEIVKAAATQLTKVSSGDFSKIKLSQPAFTHFSNEAIDQNTTHPKSNFGGSRLPQYSSSLYLVNNTFLI